MLSCQPLIVRVAMMSASSAQRFRIAGIQFDGFAQMRLGTFCAFLGSARNIRQRTQIEVVGGEIVGRLGARA